MWRTIWLGAALALATTATAEAADAQSRFQAYGLGRLSCKRFVEMCEGKKEECKPRAPGCRATSPASTP